MTIEEVSLTEYAKISSGIIFNSAGFNELNSYKIGSVRCFLFRDSKVRFALCVGVKDGNIECPFSAPFGSFVYPRKDWNISQLEESIECLDEQARSEKWRSIKLIMPPAFYNENLVAAMENILQRKGFQIKWIDLNYQLDLRRVYSENYTQLLPGNARNKLKISLRSGLTLQHCESMTEIEEAYGIIAVNRTSKGYPLRMSFEQVRNTIGIVPHDFFIVRKDGIGIAAAQVFHVADGIAQVIYWGDIPGYSEVKPMNYLAYQLIKFYGEKDFLYLDIGPSTEAGVPNYGLCSFKSSIGCDVSAKMTMEKIYDVNSWGGNYQLEFIGAFVIFTSFWRWATEWLVLVRLLLLERGMYHES